MVEFEQQVFSPTKGVLDSFEKPKTPTPEPSEKEPEEPIDRCIAIQTSSKTLPKEDQSQEEAKSEKSPKKGMADMGQQVNAI